MDVPRAQTASARHQQSHQPWNLRANNSFVPLWKCQSFRDMRQRTRSPSAPPAHYSTVNVDQIDTDYLIHTIFLTTIAVRRYHADRTATALPSVDRNVGAAICPLNSGHAAPGFGCLDGNLEAIAAADAAEEIVRVVRQSDRETNVEDEVVGDIVVDTDVVEVDREVVL